MTERAIIHVDMDAFYASIEERDNPSLRNKPIAVGGSPQGRGVVCTASYEARKYGVSSAMSSRKARALCPNLIFLPVDMQKYKEISSRLRDIFMRFSHTIEPISLDEAFLDVTGHNPVIIGREMKKQIQEELNLTASIGISYNKFLAKLASDMEKPNGFTIIKKEDTVGLLEPLPIRKLWGVGPKTERNLTRLGIYTIKDLKEYDRNILIEKFGKRGIELIDFAHGIDNRLVERNERARSIGEENTFSEDISSLKTLHKYLEIYCQDVMRRVKDKKYLVRTVTIKVKYADFSIETRSVTFDNPTDELSAINKVAHFILNNKFKLKDKVRLLGVTVSNFIYPNEPVQLMLDINDYIEEGYEK